MKALFVIGIIFFSPFLLLGTPSFGQAEIAVSITQLERLKSETEEIIDLTYTELRRSIYSGQRNRIKIGSELFKLSIINDGVVAGLLMKIRNGGVAVSAHVKNCNEIKSLIDSSVKDLSSEKLKLSRELLLAAKKLSENQPAPENFAVLASDIEKTIKEITEFDKMKKELKKSNADLERSQRGLLGCKMKLYSTPF
jgi:hypothetical protein